MVKRRYWTSWVIGGISLFVVWKSIKQPEQETARRHQSPIASPNPGLSDPDLGHQEPHPLVAKAAQAKPVHDEEQIRLENWSRHFPFKPKYHPTLRHDPSIYDPNDTATWDSPDDHNASIKYSNQRHSVVTHGFMANFHENPVRFSKEFEQLYHLLGEFDRNDNPMPVGWIFNDLSSYFQAAQNNPNDLMTKTMPYYDEESGKHGFHEVPVDGKRTWGDQMKTSRESIAYHLYQRREWPSKPQMEPERAWELADYIIQTMPADGFFSFSQGGSFAYSMDYQESLKPGDPLLIPKEGYVEAYEEYIRETHRPVLVNNMEGLPEVLILGEDGKFYDKATGEVFMPGMEPIIVEPGQKPVFP